eukprot:CAMPEP_0195253278 /NCGR_PEP_ID=MMETSP0706-20130129/4361_1 /TAXON_ID=33640 /ORGANISM="Asterionellopsis glacialis, Strain CCMP134" /LENGTH=38 /DNA_ID= /DNA_START= /DNA_END= /DNA_ORIENTATION=
MTSEGQTSSGLTQGVLSDRQIRQMITEGAIGASSPILN